METANRGFPSGDLRVCDADRDRAVAELSEHFQTGRLTQEEFEDRSGRALRARTGQEVSELFTDLPQGTPPAAMSPAGVRRAARVPMGRVIIACVVAAVIAGNVLSVTVGHSHTVNFGWLVPVFVLSYVFRRRAFGRR